MKKYSLVGFSALVLLTFLFSSCNKTPKQLEIIPSDAALVIGVDAKQMATKSINWSDLFTGNFPKSIFGKDSLISKFQNSGIDFLSPAYVFGNGNSGTNKMYVAVSFGISDRKQLAEFLKSDLASFSVEEKDNYSVGYKDQIYCVFNDKVGLLWACESNKEESLKQAMAILESEKKNSLLETNTKFSDEIKKNHDIMFYGNVDRLMSAVKSFNPFMTFNVDYKDTYFTSGINFENGQIVADYTSYSNKENFEKTKNIAKKNIDANLLNAIPGNVLASFSMASDLSALVQYLRANKLLDEDMEKNIGTMLGEGITLDYITNTFSGDMVATANQLRVGEVERYDYFSESMVKHKEPAIDFAISFGLKNEANADRILDSVVAKSNGNMVKNGNEYTMLGKYKIVKRKGALIVIGETNYANQYTANQVKSLEGRAKELISGNAVSMYADFTKVPSDVLDLAGPKMKEFVNDMPISGFESYAAKPESEVSTGKFILVFKDKEKNSLAALVDFAKKADSYFPSSPAPMPTPSYVPDSSAVYDTVAAAPAIIEDEPME